MGMEGKQEQLHYNGRKFGLLIILFRGNVTVRGNLVGWNENVGI